MRDAHHHFSNLLRYRAGDHPDQTQLTPAYVLDLVRAALGGTIGLDPCTTPDNPVGADQFFCLPDDGAEKPWDAETIFVNPPYGKARDRWVRRCCEAGEDGKEVVLLMPAATDTRIFQQALASASAVVFIRGRLKFGTLRPNRRQEAASHPSALIGWNVRLAACSALGIRISLLTASAERKRIAELAIERHAYYVDSRPPGFAIGDGRFTHPFSDLLGGES